MVHFLEPLDTNHAYIGPPISLALTYFICHLFYMIINEKIVDDSKVLLF